MRHLDLLPSRPATSPDLRTLLDCLVGTAPLPRSLTLWLVLLAPDGTMAGPVLPVADLPRRPGRLLAAGLMSAIAASASALTPAPASTSAPALARAPAPCAAMARTDPQVLLGYVRRGGGRRGPQEAAWSRALHSAAHAEGVQVAAEVAVGARRARSWTGSPPRVHGTFTADWNTRSSLDVDPSE